MSAVVSLATASRTARTCTACSTRSVCVARGLDATALRQFESVGAAPRLLRRGEALFRAGSHCDSLYLVRSGSLKVTYCSVDGEEQIVGFCLPGDMLGLDGIDGECRRTTAKALETSSVCLVRCPILNGDPAHADAPGLHTRQLIGREFKNQQEHLLIIGRRDAETRLAVFLLSLSARFERLGYSAQEFQLSMSRKEIGDYLGLTLETVSRTFTRFRDLGWIDCECRLVRLLDTAALRARGGMQAIPPVRRAPGAVPRPAAAPVRTMAWGAAAPVRHAAC